MQKKIKNGKNIMGIVKLIRKFNQLDQEGSGLKMLTPKQMLSRLPFFSSVKGRK